MGSCKLIVILMLLSINSLYANDLTRISETYLNEHPDWKALQLEMQIQELARQPIPLFLVPDDLSISLAGGLTSSSISGSLQAGISQWIFHPVNSEELKKSYEYSNMTQLTLKRFKENLLYDLCRKIINGKNLLVQIEQQENRIAAMEQLVSGSAEVLRYQGIRRSDLSFSKSKLLVMKGDLVKNQLDYKNWKTGMLLHFNEQEIATLLQIDFTISENSELIENQASRIKNRADIKQYTILSHLADADLKIAQAKSLPMLGYSLEAQLGISGNYTIQAGLDVSIPFNRNYTSREKEIHLSKDLLLLNQNNIIEESLNQLMQTLNELNSLDVIEDLYRQAAEEAKAVIADFDKEFAIGTKTLLDAYTLQNNLYLIEADLSDLQHQRSLLILDYYFIIGALDFEIF